MNKILLVEGKDDEHVIYAIRDIYEISKDSFKIKDKKGIENVLEETDSTLIDGNPDNCLGIVIDADEDLNIQWQRITSILRKADYDNEIIPNIPDANGTVIKQEFKPTFGVWIMPDNVITRGYLETFLTFLVPEPKNNKTWQKAKSCVDSLEDKPFIKQEADHTTKAEIHTYLAWQKEPGKPFGTAITAKYLQAENPNCSKFVEWLKRLFVE